jgi:renalase
VHSGTEISALDHEGHTSRWLAATTAGHTLGPFDAVIVATPARQALRLVSASTLLTQAIGRVHMHPCWAALVAFDEAVSTPFDAAYVTSSPLGWIARDRSKPQRGLAETWVLHASAAWSGAHLDDAADTVGPFLLNAFADLVRARLPLPVYLGAHRWRLACADPPLAVEALADADRRLYAAGDWCAGNRVEGAFLSGLAAARLVG